MSYLSQVLRKQITWSQFADRSVGYAQRVVAHDATLSAAAGAVLTVVKQGGSDAISIADSALGAHAAGLAETVEKALDLALAGATGGLTVPLNPLIDAGIDQLVNIAVATVHAKALEYKAQLSVPAAAKPA